VRRRYQTATPPALDEAYSGRRPPLRVSVTSSVPSVRSMLRWPSRGGFGALPLVEFRADAAGFVLFGGQSVRTCVAVAVVRRSFHRMDDAVTVNSCRAVLGTGLRIGTSVTCAPSTGSASSSPSTPRTAASSACSPSASQRAVCRSTAKVRALLATLAAAAALRLEQFPRRTLHVRHVRLRADALRALRGRRDAAHSGRRPAHPPPPDDLQLLITYSS
jgi:hypothetical protein